MKPNKILFSVMALILIILDQAIKKWAMTSLIKIPSITVIPGLFSLTYVENRGAAFGIFQGNTKILAVITGITLVAALIAVYSGKIGGIFISGTFMVIIAGGIGNFIDRAFRGYVVDYLDFSALFGFPVFNFADCCVVTGTIILLIYILLLEKKESRKGLPS